MKACIFDLDGVIVETAKYHFKAWQNIAKQFNLDFTQTHNAHLKGVSRKKSLIYILELAGANVSEERQEQLMQEKNEQYLDLIDKLDRGEMLAGVLKLLDQLKEENYKIALGSASKNAQHILKNLDITDYFEVIIDGTNCNVSKPDPAVFLMGAEGLGVEVSETVVFEDALKGIQAANTGGFYSIGVGDATQLKEANHVISGFENFELKDLKNLVS